MLLIHAMIAKMKKTGGNPSIGLPPVRLINAIWII